MQSEKVREAVRSLRRSIKTPDGDPISQTEFGRLIGKSLNTIQRYEGLVAPKGVVLWDLRALAAEHGQLELAKLFEDAGLDDGDRDWLPSVAEIWRIARIAIEEHKKGVEVDFPNALDEIVDICIRINPLVAWAYSGRPGDPMYRSAKKGEDSYRSKRKQLKESKADGRQQKRGTKS